MYFAIIYGQEYMNNLYKKIGAIIQLYNDKNGVYYTLIIQKYKVHTNDLSFICS